VKSSIHSEVCCAVLDVFGESETKLVWGAVTFILKIFKSWSYPVLSCHIGLMKVAENKEKDTHSVHFLFETQWTMSVLANSEVSISVTHKSANMLVFSQFLFMGYLRIESYLHTDFEFGT